MAKEKPNATERKTFRGQILSCSAGDWCDSRRDPLSDFCLVGVYSNHYSSYRGKPSDEIEQFRHCVPDTAVVVTDYHVSMSETDTGTRYVQYGTALVQR